MVVPFCTTVRKARSSATSQPTSMLAIGMPPPSSGFGARRVHSTTPVGSGSPDATPSVNGYSLKAICALSVRVTTDGVTAARPSFQAALSSSRREKRARAWS